MHAHAHTCTHTHTHTHTHTRTHTHTHAHAHTHRMKLIQREIRIGNVRCHKKGMWDRGGRVEGEEWRGEKPSFFFINAWVKHIAGI